MIVVSGSASRSLGRELAKELSCDLVETETRIFPDGEFKVKVNVPEGEEIVVVQSCPPPQARNLLELFFILDACKKSKVTVIPYLAFSRQDKEFLKGEVVSSKVIAKLLESMGANKILTVDIHSRLVLEFFSSKPLNITAMASLGRHLKNKVTKPTVIAPDENAMKYAEPLRKETNGTSVFFEKRRDRNTGDVAFKFPKTDVNGKDVIICDDIVSSGSTMIPAIRFAKEGGAKKIYVCVTHALFLDGVIEKLRKEGADEILASDSVERKDVTMVSVAKDIAQETRKII